MVNDPHAEVARVRVRLELDLEVLARQIRGGIANLLEDVAERGIDAVVEVDVERLRVVGKSHVDVGLARRGADAEADVDVADTVVEVAEQRLLVERGRALGEQVKVSGGE